jgi:hypothetical protein
MLLTIVNALILFSLYFRGKLWHQGSFWFCLSSMEQMVVSLLPTLLCSYYISNELHQWLKFMKSKCYLFFMNNIVVMLG